jgi:uncharacterized repeat protein (TIGR03803 family)
MHRIFSRSRFFLLVLAIALAPTLGQAQTYTELFDFDGTNHGCCPTSPGVLAQGRDGNLYGTTIFGGANGIGNVFKFGLDGTMTVLHNFNLTDGSEPQGGLSLGLDGNLYGTTSAGGTNLAGTVFKITPAGVITTIYNFTNGSEGGFPHNAPVTGNDGSLYGTTVTGTKSTIYKLTTAGVFKSLVTLGLECDGPLTLGSDGKFYGVTQLGGTFGRGSVFSVTPAGVLKTVVSFNDPTGAIPFGPILQATDGNFYGTASVGGALSAGVVYKLTSAGIYTVLHSFDTNTRSGGINPLTGMVQGSDGFLYGVTAGGGQFLGGTIFKIKTDGSVFSVLYNFDVTHGSAPYSQPILHTNGTIFGLTNAGGSFNDGVFYSFNAGLKSFILPVAINAAKVNASVGILGQNLSTATKVLFGTGPGTITPSGDGYISARPTAGANTGIITVKEPGGNQLSPQKFKILPSIISFAPPSGPVGTSVVITGMSFSQTTSVKFGTKAASFTINSNTQITATVPTGAVTSKITITTQGGTATSATNFTME